jgi:hypothetical protein
LAQDYRIVSGENETLGRFNCRVLTLEAITTEVTYPRMKVWISEDNLLRKSEDYSLSGQLLRTSGIRGYYNINGRFVPREILFVDEQRFALINGRKVNEMTTVTITQPSFGRLPDSSFSKTYLESVSR